MKRVEGVKSFNSRKKTRKPRSGEIFIALGESASPRCVVRKDLALKGRQKDLSAMRQKRLSNVTDARLFRAFSASVFY